MIKPAINHNQEPDYGKRLLTRVLDDVASTSPHKLYATTPLSDEVPYKFRDITFADLVRCVNFLAFWLEERIGRSDSFETLGFIGIADLRGTVFFHAAVKLGYKILLMSPRNPPETNLSLMEQTNCSNLCYVTELTPVRDAIMAIAENKLSSIAIPTFDSMMESQPKSYVYNGTFTEHENDPTVIFHSSGSTGLPKPIQMTHGSFAAMDNDRRLENIDGRKKQDFTIWDFPSPSKFYFSFPPFHLAGFLSLVIVPLFSSTATPVLGPALKPPSGFLAADILGSQDVRALFVPPIIIEQLLGEPQGIEYFRKMDFVCYAGGPLSQFAGDSLKDVVDLCQYYGSTETSNIPQLLPSRDNWAYMEWHPANSIEMQPFDLEEGTYEMVQFLNDDTRAHSLLNHNLPGLREWRTKDLFKRHPTEEKLWQFSSRVDDIIVLSNGHKFNPVTAESIVQEHPLVAGALIVGLGRFQPALLVELKSPDANSVAVIDSIWPTIERANARLPGQGRISRNKIIVVARGKPFHRTAKGTIVRKLTEKDFVHEIERLYTDADDVTTMKAPIWQMFEEEALKRLLQAVVSQSLPKVEISEQDDLFLRGLDSLKTLEMVQAVRAGLRHRLTENKKSRLSSRMVYENPSIEKLARAISRLLDLDNSAVIPAKKHQESERANAMSVMAEKYSQGLEKLEKLPAKAIKDSDLHIALTGSTGSFGCRLLCELLQDPKIAKISCLDRSDNAQEKHQANLLTANLDRSRTSYHQIDINEPELGLAEPTMSMLTRDVDIIVHNAWKVDFNQTLASFKNHIRGTRSIIDWSMRSPKRPRVVFVSSISSVRNWSRLQGQEPVPNAPISDYRVASNMGYGESKLVAETILARGNERAGVPVSILRVGQIAGSTVASDAAWPAQEWFPSLVKTSKTLGMIPQDLPRIDWIPIDRLAASVKEIIDVDSGTEGLAVYNLVNPKTTPWSSLSKMVRASCGEDSKVVPLASWLDELEQTDVDTLDEKELASKPALKILPVLRELLDVKMGVEYDTSRAVEASRSMRDLSAVNESWLQGWLQQILN